MRRSKSWPAALIAAGATVALAATWLDDTLHGQARVMRTGVVLTVAMVALLVWLLFFWRLSRRARARALIAVVLVLAGGAVFFRVRGVTGNLVPIIGLRFGSQPPLAAVVSTATRATEPMPASSHAPPAPKPSETPSPAQPPSPDAAAPPNAATDPADYPQFLGTTRDATLPGPALSRDWSAQPPRLLWRQAIGAGWSGFAVSGARAVTQEQRGDTEQVTAYEATTGRVLWMHGDRARYETTIAGIGPRATPSIAQGRVFTVGATGILNALDVATGRRSWSRQIIAENNGNAPGWGKSSSPLVFEGRVIVSTGGPGRSLAAYDAATGEPLWAAGDGRASYSSPRLADIAGHTQVVVFNEATLTGHDPKSGAVLWEQSFPGQQPNVATPAILSGDRVLVSAGYGVGSKMYRIARGPGDGFTPTLLWESMRLKSKFANLVVSGAHVYGLDDGVLTCLDPTTGERVWKAGRHGHGQMILAGDTLLIQTEEGEIVLVEPSPQGPRELTRFAPLSGKTWNPPALAGRILLVRNDAEAAAYELPVE